MIENAYIFIILLLAILLSYMAWKLKGLSWKEYFSTKDGLGILKGIVLAPVAIIILAIVGILVGVWLVSGVVPTMIYYGLKVLNPSIFLVATLLICSITSLATGTSWGTMGTMGLALMGIATGLGIPAPVAAGAVISGAYFTIRKSKKNNLTIWDSTTKKLLVNFAIPLAIGGLFCAGLLYHHLHGLLAPTTLIFYGLALFNAGNYTYSDVKYLGLCEISLGIISVFFLGYGLFFWAIGFGILHIVYGIVMHKKYK